MKSPTRAFGISSGVFLALRLIVGALFIYSGYAKLLEPSSNFTGAILSYKVVNLEMASWIAAVFPWIELVAGVFFVLGLWFWFSFFILWGMNILFMLMILWAKARGVPLEHCGCFGEASHALPIGATLALDVLLCLIFIWMLSRKKEAGHFSLDRF